MAMPREAERLLATVEDKRHNQIFLIVEMANELPDQGVAGVGVAIAGRSQAVAILKPQAEEFVGRLDKFINRRRSGLSISRRSSDHLRRYELPIFSTDFLALLYLPLPNRYSVYGVFYDSESRLSPATNFFGNSRGP